MPWRCHNSGWFCGTPISLTIMSPPSRFYRIKEIPKQLGISSPFRIADKPERNILQSKRGTNHAAKTPSPGLPCPGCSGLQLVPTLQRGLSWSSRFWSGMQILHQVSASFFNRCNCSYVVFTNMSYIFFQRQPCTGYAGIGSGNFFVKTPCFLTITIFPKQERGWCCLWGPLPRCSSLPQCQNPLRSNKVERRQRLHGKCYTRQEQGA